MVESAEREIQQATRITGSIRPPGSKSITNRALVCAALASGRSELRGVLDSDDTRVMVDSLQRLGLEVAEDWAGERLVVEGCGGRLPRESADLFVGNSGTTVRFLTALVALGQGSYRLDGVPRMRERPIQDLLDALRDLGVDAVSEAGTGCPPVLVRASGLAGGRVRIRGDVSSQFLSGLLLSAPYARERLTIEVAGQLVSQPYVTMTCQVMEAFGGRVDREGANLRVSNDHPYRPRLYWIEPDASAASYFWAAAAITGGSVVVEGLTPEAMQGDVKFCDCLRQMGCRVETLADGIRVTGGELRGIDVDMNAISDTVQTLAAVALFAQGPTRVHGVGHIRHKETDRIGDLARELRKLGATVNEDADGLEIHPGPLHGARIATYDDHRMAMSLSLPGLRVPGVVIENPGCTAKTYPKYFDDLDRLAGMRGV
jgi:3-phosphoshikimate 1-carboxyvinyltransferase